ncbi:MAG: M20/M25/M40 family metallo-hydrolase [Pyrinomonadaceae bacterium]|nr:M20/M25/M40 family metallo-hydrolase [Pyrinomonadaceae bacterium]MCX7640168.1 M20/M25/M40 family metallo-hydrolase [Pyrinomonadaceae bacterium]MDW8303244.1 M20/M25/M40 family metallo-hydrolase [Acidobacteriota bacterium]
MNLFELTLELIKIPSISGEEETIGFFLKDYLTELGWTTELQPVSEKRNNLIAYLNDSPEIFLSTHMDTVPPFIEPHEDEEKIYGRGACDAKGIIAAQIFAAENLRKQGFTNLGLLFTVDEELSSQGAKIANTHPIAKKCKYLINGEPTDNYLAIGSKGSLRLLIKTYGKAAHSAYPEEGESAIEKLLDILQEIRQTKLPSDDFFGETTLNIGTISGGLKTNIIPPFAEAGLHVRLTTDEREILKILRSKVRDKGEIEVLTIAKPVKMLAIEGFNQKVVRFTTDIPHLDNWGKPLLLGPGSILVAHTDKEFVRKQDLIEAVSLYETLVKKLNRELEK